MYSPGRPVDFFFPDVPKEAWGPYREAQLDENGEIALPYLLFALRSQGQTIMIDTGMGPGPHVSRGNRTGDLINQLKRHGIGPDDVDVVVHTHLHADHVGWNVTYENGQPTATFPKARYLVPRPDWDYFTQPDILSLERNEHVRDYVVPLEGLGVMDLIDPGHNITSEVSTMHTPGHTPGHICVMINSQGQSGAVVGDVFHMSVADRAPRLVRWRGLGQTHWATQSRTTAGALRARGHDHRRRPLRRGRPLRAGGARRGEALLAGPVTRYPSSPTVEAGADASRWPARRRGLRAEPSARRRVSRPTAGRLEALRRRTRRAR